MPPLSTLCSVSSGYSLRTGVVDDAARGVPVVQVRNVDWERGGIDWAGLSVAEDVEPDPDRLLRGGDVLFAARGQTNRAVLVQKDRGAVAASAFLVVRPVRDDVDPAYVAWYLNTDPAQAHVARCARGTKIRSVPKPCLGSVVVPLPALAVQRRVAGAVRLAAEERALVADLAERRARLVDALCLQNL